MLIDLIVRKSQITKRVSVTLPSEQVLRSRLLTLHGCLEVIHLSTSDCSEMGCSRVYDDGRFVVRVLYN